MSQLIQRPRRLRRTPVLRDLVAETRLSAQALMLPHFLLPQDRGVEDIPSMPGIQRLGLEDLLRQAEADLELGLSSVLLFGISEHKDPLGDAAAAADGAVQRGVAALKQRFGNDLLVITDVCLCAYTDHGHCGHLSLEGEVINDSSLRSLADAAISHAAAGADLVAPSDMMDGRVGALRQALDSAGFANTGILSYAVKYASAYYGPFRDAANSAPGKGDRKSYQMDPRNVREALRECLLDEAEGADMLMVKPALAYLDVISRVADASSLPLACYNVSGEYSAVKAAAAAGWLDEGQIVRENLTAMSRAGADILITYHARDAVREGWLS